MRYRCKRCGAFASNNKKHKCIVVKTIPPSRKGIKHTEETKKKMSLAMKGKPKPNSKTKELWKNPNYKNHMSEAHKGKKQSDETIEKRVSKFRGKNHHFWKGGVTPINERIRKSKEYKIWRTAVFERDNYTCIWCGSRSGYGKAIELNADHIKPFSLFPELRFAIDNGRTLCKSCHKKTSTYGRPKKCK